MRGAKEEYERSIALNMKGDNKIFWKYIQSKTKTKENIPCIMDENAELLNNFFKSVFTTDSTQGIPPFSTTTIHNLEIVKFDSKNIQEHLEKLKETKSSGPDQIYSKYLKETAKSIAVPLEKIVNTSMETSQYQTVGGWQI